MHALDDQLKSPNSSFAKCKWYGTLISWKIANNYVDHKRETINYYVNKLFQSIILAKNLAIELPKYLNLNLNESSYQAFDTRYQGIINIFKFDFRFSTSKVIVKYSYEPRKKFNNSKLFFIHNFYTKFRKLVCNLLNSLRCSAIKVSKSFSN